MTASNPPLLATKLYAPAARPNLVPRPRLTVRLSEGTTFPLTLISAPAGFGKTTLISEWRAENPDMPLAWVALDEGDNDPLRFWSYVFAAVDGLRPGAGERARSALAAPERTAIEAALLELINSLTANPPRLPLVLALDDYHVISAAAVHDGLAFLLEHLPPYLRLVLTSRADPPLPLARLRARGQLSEIRADDLRFTAAESAEFLNRVMGLSLSAADVAALEARTEGWAAGLQLAALSIREQHDIPGFIAAFTGSHRYVLDYLADEVFHRQPDDVQSFLLQTAILDRLCGGLCDAVTGAAYGQAMLERLEAANLFIIALDGERRWYRYHHLFADSLCARLRQTRPADWAALHCRAAEWCEHNHLMEDAVRYALAGGEFERATRLIRQMAETLWSRSQILTLLAWLKAVPEEFVRSHASLCLLLAWAYAINGQLDLVEPWVQATEAHLPAEPPASDAAIPNEMEWGYSASGLKAQAAIVRTFVARFRAQTVEAIAHGEEALRLLPRGRTRGRGVALVFLGHAHLLEGNFEAAEQCLLESMGATRAVSHLAAYLSAMHYLAQLYTQQGQLQRAADHYREAQRFILQTGEPSLSGIEYVGQANLLREWNDLPSAMACIRKGLQLAKTGGDFTFIRDACVVLARIEAAFGNFPAAAAALGQADEVARRSRNVQDSAALAAWRARLALAQGDLAAAHAWSREAGARTAADTHYRAEFEQLTFARVLIARGRAQPRGPDLPEADRILELVRAAAEATSRRGRVIEALMLQALAAHARGQTDAALAALGQALSIAEPEGYIRLFVDEGVPMAELLRLSAVRRAWVDPRLAPYAEKLLAARGADQASLPAPADEPRSAAPAESDLLVEPLSAREVEILALVASGLANREIADRLVVGVGTVNWHINNIYRKLGVHSRTQAVARARSLGLLRA